VELYLHFPNTPSWRGARLRKAQGQLYLYFTAALKAYEPKLVHTSEKIHGNFVRLGGNV